MARNKDPSNLRNNYWCSIVYPESCYAEWQKNLDSLHIRAVVSPLHFADEDGETGWEGKPHYHVMFMYDSLKSRKQAQENFDFVFGEKGYTRSYLIPPDSKVGMLKYFCHLKNPEKQKLDPANVITFGGVEYLEEIAEDKSTFWTLMEMTEYIHRNHVCSFVNFMLFCQYNNQEWCRIASTKSTLYIKAVIESERNWFKDDVEEKNFAATTTSREINNQ